MTTIDTRSFDSKFSTPLTVLFYFYFIVYDILNGVFMNTTLMSTCYLKLLKHYSHRRI